MNSFQKLLGISALIISIAIAFYLIIYLPQKDSKVLEQEKLRQEALFLKDEYKKISENEKQNFSFTSTKGENFVFNLPEDLVLADTKIIKLKNIPSSTFGIYLDTNPILPIDKDTRIGFSSLPEIVWEESPVILGDKNYTVGRIYHGGILSTVMYKPIWTEELGVVEIHLGDEKEDDLKYLIEKVIMTIRKKDSENSSTVN